MEKILKEYDGRPIVKYDPVPKVMPLLSKGYVVSPDGKMRKGATSKSLETPWIYVRHRKEIACSFCTEILFNSFQVFPRSCLNCWKVVVRPRTVMELIMLLELQENLTGRACKCGIEKRSYVPAHYGGYFYNDSRKEGLECLEDVRNLVSENISPDIKVILKRYCTEFELKFGPSSQIEESLVRGFYIDSEGVKVPIMKIGEMQIWEQAASRIFDINEDKTYQPDWIKQHVIASWFQWAWKNGDMTVKEFFNGDPLFPPSDTYES